MERPCCFSVESMASERSAMTDKENQISVAMLVEVIILHPTCTIPE